MAEYIGKRIVPRHDGVWSSTKTYENLVIVMDASTGDSYTSRRDVPAGTPLSDTTYWAKSGAFNAQLKETYSQIGREREEEKKYVDSSIREMRTDLARTETGLKEKMSIAETQMKAEADNALDMTNRNRSEMEKRMAAIETRLDANVSASTNSNKDYAAEVVDARTSSAGTAYESLGAHIRAVEAGSAVEKLDARKAMLPLLTMEPFYKMAAESKNESFSFAYDKEGDWFTYSCVKDYKGDHIFYGPFLTPRQYALLRQMGGMARIRFRTRECTDGRGVFHLAVWLCRMGGPDSLSISSIVYATYFHTFRLGAEEVDLAVDIKGNGFTYDPAQACYYHNGAPVSIAILLYANSPVAGEGICISTKGGLLSGFARNGEMLGMALNSLSADVLTLEDTARENGRWIKFVPDSVFAPDDSKVEEVTDEYGDRTYRITYAGNNPMEQMYLTGILPEDCREVIVELTARRLSEGGHLRVQMYDQWCGMNHMDDMPILHTLQKNYRKYRYRVARLNSGNTALGIGPSRNVGASVQFKNVKIFIPDMRSKDYPMRDREYHGFLDGTDFSRLKSVPLEDGLLAGTDDMANTDGMILDTIDVYLEASLLYATFKVGLFDQYGLFQEHGEIKVSLHRGYNHVKLDVKEIRVPAGCGVFMVWQGDMRLYKATVSQPFRNLVSTKGNYFENGEGYSGYPLAETQYLVPFRYSLVTKGMDARISHLEAESGKMMELSDRMGKLEETGNALVNAMRDPDGIKYHLSVNGDGTLSAIRSIPKKAVVFGNSLTLGFGTFGMAASDSRHDYFHYVKQFLVGKNAGLIMERYGASNWEGETTSEARKTAVEGFISKMDGTEDLVIIQLSDNVNTTAKKKTYPQDVKTMVSMFRKACPKARILWIAAWYGWEANYAAIEEAAKIYGIDVVDIRDLSVMAENRSAIGNTYTRDDGTTEKITSAGVASHPGDLGMKRIAERVIHVLEKYM